MKKMRYYLLPLIMCLLGLQAHAQVDVCASVSGTTVAVTYEPQADYNALPDNFWNSQLIMLRYPDDVTLTWAAPVATAGFTWSEDSATPGAGLDGGDGFIYKVFVSFNNPTVNMTDGVPLEVFTVEVTSSDSFSFEVADGWPIDGTKSIALNHAIDGNVFGAVSTNCGSAAFNSVVAVCGNGSVDAGEDCDDGNTNNLDGCSAVCDVEYGYTCTGDPSVCELDPDSDGDGVTDADETGILNTDPNDANSNSTHPNSTSDEGANATNDAVEDFDGDGFSNLEELRAGTDPWDVGDAPADSDSDGVSDNDETGILGTDPNDADSDSSNTAADENDNSTNDDAEDFDGDGISNIDELEAGSNPLDPNSTPGDLDGDGLTLAQETTLGTDSRDADSDSSETAGTDENDNSVSDFDEDLDGDGFSNGIELAAGTDPLDSNSFPASPGGVSGALALWLKADAGTSTTVEGADVLTWLDQSASGLNTAIVDNGATAGYPDYLLADNAGFNHNPTLDFPNDNNQVLDFTQAVSVRTAFFVLDGVQNTNQATPQFSYGSVLPDNFDWFANTPNFAATGLASAPFLNADVTIDGELKGLAKDIARPNGPTALPFILNYDLDGANLDAYGFGAGNMGHRTFNSEIAEIIVYDDVVGGPSKQAIQSYLALKYGITLDGSGFELGASFNEVDHLNAVNFRVAKSVTNAQSPDFTRVATNSGVLNSVSIRPRNLGTTTHDISVTVTTSGGSETVVFAVAPNPPATMTLPMPELSITAGETISIDFEIEADAPASRDVFALMTNPQSQMTPVAGWPTGLFNNVSFRLSGAELDPLDVFYIASDGTTKMWDTAAADGRVMDIAGLGRDDASELNQKQSTSVNSDALVTMGLSTIEASNAANSAAFPNDLTFMTWANDDGTTARSEALAGTSIDHMLRTWRVQETGTVGTVTVSIPQSAFTAGESAVLLRSTDDTFESSDTQVALTDDSNGNYTGTIDFAAGDYFTFGEEPADTDGDGDPDVTDLDDDNDGVLDTDEVALGTDPLDPDSDSTNTAGTDENDNGASDFEEDFDGDGFTNGQEIAAGSDPLDENSVPADTDGDGVSDFDETNILGTDPNDADSDSSNTSPIDEGNNGLTDAQEDFDGDGSTNAQELAAGSDPLDPTSTPTDSDGDGVSNADEVNILKTDPNDSDSDSTETTGTDEDDNGTGDAEEDFDGDGFSNVEELRAGSDPHDPASKPADSDGDGVSNIDEISILGTSPTDADSDSSLTTPANENDNGIDDATEDFDGDGVSNAAEIAAGSDPLDPTSTPTDLDGDGLTNAEELVLGTNPNDVDSDSTNTTPDEGGNGASDYEEDFDGDGYSNGEEIAAGSDPLDPTSTPTDTDGDTLSDVAETNETLTAINDTDSDSTGTAGVNENDNNVTDDLEDLDGDGFNNGQEVAAGTDPQDPESTPIDSDGDGVSNADEVNILGTDPNDADSDSTETAANENDNGTGDADEDFDGDGFSNIEELRAGTDPLDAGSTPLDTDGDGVTDTDEINVLGTDPTVANSDSTNTPGTDESTNGIDDGNEDLDGDGFTNLEELAAGSDPVDPKSTPSDLDGDGVSNADEVILGTSPTDGDSDSSNTLGTDEGDNLVGDGQEDFDGDGSTNAEELRAGTDPLDPNSTPADADGDGLSDFDETNLTGTNPNDADSDSSLTTLVDEDDNSIGDAQEDLDGDGFSNLEEIKAGTDPVDPADTPTDSDGDTISDVAEVTVLGTDPTDVDSDSTNTPQPNEAGNSTNDNLEDFDGDGVSNEEELAAGSDPLDPTSTPTDLDGDGVSNEDEVTLGTSPVDADSDSSNTSPADENDNGASDFEEDFDGDGWSNGEELAAGSDPLDENSVPADTDGDGVSNTDEAILGTDPTVADSDSSNTTPDEAGNGLNDGQEDFDGDGYTNAQELEAGSDPLDENSKPADTDGDGVSNADEVNTLGTDPTDANSDSTNTTPADESLNAIDDGAEDFDGDGFSNLEELRAGTDPLDPASTPDDTDMDGVSNVDEVNVLGTDPTNANSDSTNTVPADESTNAIDDGAEDFDGDGATNLEELAAGSDPLDENSTPGDLDGDGLTNAEELVLGTNPNDSDSDSTNTTPDEGGNGASDYEEDFDGDGFSNGEEIAAGSDPLDPTSTPTDTDGDTLSDTAETDTTKTSTTDADSDSTQTTSVDENDNGYGDAEEDFDGDGATNGQEIAAGTDPFDPTDSPTDNDGDGISNADEVNILGTDPNDSDSDSNKTSPANENDNGTGDAEEDFDNDGFSNLQELAAGTDPLDAGSTPLDTDGDGVTDADEVNVLGTNPNVANSDSTNTAGTDESANAIDDGDEDFDGDGVTNIEELAAGSDPFDPNSTPTDRDGDGVSNDDEVTLGTDPDDADSDSSKTSPENENGNLVGDGQEDFDGDGWSNAEELRAGTDPLDGTDEPLDTDGDTISDVDEAAILGTSATDDDSDSSNTTSVDENDNNIGDAQEDFDGDGFTNGQEIAAGSDPIDPTDTPVDTDGDGVSDVEEVTILGTDPTVADSDSTNTTPADESGNGKTDAQEDFDGDGFSNIEELRAGTDPFDPASMPTDTDMDGVSDNDEVNILGTDPTVADSDSTITTPADESGNTINDGAEDFDGDGASNKEELAAGTDPFDNLDFPPLDTDGDGVLDSVDADSDGDGIPDSVEIANALNGGDTDGDGVDDYLDLDSDNDGINDVREAGGLTDADGDGKADGTDTSGDGAIDGAITTALNSDNDTTPNYLDLDSDNDTISDLIEGGQGGSDSNTVDANDDGVIDGVDTDGDGIIDAVDGLVGFGDLNDSPLPNSDFPVDNIPNYLEVDSNNDGTNDIEDAGNLSLDGNGDGQVDPTGDADFDGVDDSVDDDDMAFGGISNPSTDLDGDGIPNSVEGCNVATDDFDGDGLANCEDDDSDGDGIHDAIEAGLDPSNPVDTDGDLQPNYLDLDSDNDSINDVHEAYGTDVIVNSTSLAGEDGFHDGIDGNSDGIADAPLTPDDRDRDGIPNYLDLDSDGDAVSDICEGGQFGSSGAVADIDPDNDGHAEGADADMDGIIVIVDGDVAIGDASSILPLPDADFDSLPDYLDPVNSTTNIRDITTVGEEALDVNADGVIDDLTDTDKDGIADSVDTAVGTFGGLGKPVTSAFELWQTANAPDAGTTPGSDNDGDGMSDLCEYAFGADPSTGVNLQVDGSGAFIAGQEPALNLVSDATGEKVEMTFNYRDSLTDIAFTLEKSADLLGWADATSTADTSVANGDATRTDTYDDISTELGDIGYLRLKVTLTQGALTGTTCYSKTFGYYKTTLSGALQTYSSPFMHSAEYVGTIDSQLATGVTVAESLDLSNLVQAGESYYLEIVDGIHAGERFDVSAAGMSSFTVDVNATTRNTSVALPAGLTGSKFVVRKHRTLGEVLDITNFSLQAGFSSGQADEAQVWDGTSFESYFAFSGSSQWSDAGFNDSSNVIIPPGGGVLFKVEGGAGETREVIQTGCVRENDFRLPLQEGLTLMASAYPVAQTPLTLGMTSANGFTSATTGGSADELQPWKGDSTPGASGFESYYFNSLTSSWTDAGFVSQDNVEHIDNARASFVKTQNAILGYVQPSPWNPDLDKE